MRAATQTEGPTAHSRCSTHQEGAYRQLGKADNAFCETGKIEGNPCFVKCPRNELCRGMTRADAKRHGRAHDKKQRTQTLGETACGVVNPIGGAGLRI
jgi:hypothetical protein